MTAAPAALAASARPGPARRLTAVPATDSASVSAPAPAPAIPAIRGPQRSAEPSALAEAAPPAGYYAAAQGKQGAELVRALHQIVRNGHVDRGYRQAREALFDLVEDPAGTDTVVDVYSGREHPGVKDSNTAYRSNLNTEHTWPQSLGARGIAQSDLHQLMPSDILSNSQRSNHPYGEVKQVHWSNGASAPNESVLGVDELGRTVFEPRASVKGDIARALMYFYVRYDHSRPADYSLRNFRQELPTLLQWHEQDPVDDRERLRNGAIFEVQRNRNPFVDHPEFAQAAGFPDLPTRG